MTATAVELASPMLLHELFPMFIASALAFQPTAATASLHAYQC